MRERERDVQRQGETGRDRVKQGETVREDRQGERGRSREKQGLGNLYCGTPAATGEVF